MDAEEVSFRIDGEESRVAAFVAIGLSSRRSRLDVNLQPLADLERNRPVLHPRRGDFNSDRRLKLRARQREAVGSARRIGVDQRLVQELLRIQRRQLGPRNRGRLGRRPLLLKDEVEERPGDVVAQIAAARGKEDVRAGPGGGLRSGDRSGRATDHDDIHLVDDGNLRRAGRHRGAQKARHHKRCRKRCREHCHKLCREHCRSIFPATIE